MHKLLTLLLYKDNLIQLNLNNNLNIKEKICLFEKKNVTKN